MFFNLLEPNNSVCKQIFVMINGKTTTINMLENETIYEIKRKIEKKTS